MLASGGYEISDQNTYWIIFPFFDVFNTSVTIIEVITEGITWTKAASLQMCLVVKSSCLWSF